MAAGNGRAPAPPPSLPQAPGGCRRCRPLAAAARPPPPQPQPWRARSAGSRRRAGRATAAAGGSGRRLGGRRRGRCRLPRCRAGPGRRCWARRGWRWAAASRRRSAGSGPCAAWAASSAPTCSSGAWGGGRAWAGGGPQGRGGRVLGAFVQQGLGELRGPFQPCCEPCCRAPVLCFLAKLFLLGLHRGGVVVVFAASLLFVPVADHWPFIVKLLQNFPHIVAAGDAFNFLI